MPTPTTWVAALEELPPDSRGYRRVLRLHAVAVPTCGREVTAVCGYTPRGGELRTDRPWTTVTPSGRCALCDLQVRRAATVDLNAAEERHPGAPARLGGDVSPRR